MPLAFVIDGDKILCQLTDSEWMPVMVSLPEPVVSDYYQQRSLNLGMVALLNDDSDLSTAGSAKPIEVASSSVAGAATVTLQPTCTLTPTSTVAFALSKDFAISQAIVWSQSSQFISYRQLMTYVAEPILQQLSVALQLLHWQAQHRFCAQCGSTLQSCRESLRAMHCGRCQSLYYPRIQPCIITAVTRMHPQTGKAQILLAHHHRYGKREVNPQYGLLAGFVEVGESLEQAVHREVYEEVGINIHQLQYLGSQPWPFPGNLMLGFHAEYQAGDIIIEESELSHADFFDFEQLPKIPAKGSIAYRIIQQLRRRYHH